jgi:hypothetical protein
VLNICGALDGRLVFISPDQVQGDEPSFAQCCSGASAATPPAGRGLRGGKGRTTCATGRHGQRTRPSSSKTPQSVIIGPGYGMAVARRRTRPRSRGRDVGNGYERPLRDPPVAGRMPGHYERAVAEANVPLDQLYSWDAINESSSARRFDRGGRERRRQSRQDVAGSRSSACRSERRKSKAVIVLKRSMKPGFAASNELFVLPQTMWCFGDAKQTLGKITAHERRRSLAPRAVESPRP